jgi:hypothetical protein
MRSRTGIYLFTFFLLLVAGIFLFRNNFLYLLNKEPGLNNKEYSLELDSVRTIKQGLYTNKAGASVLEKNFTELITTRIFPYWYGTKWDYYGTTEMPNEGSIACGYFVTTTLRDMGVPINRTKMAQCASEEMIRSLATKKNIHHLSNMGIFEFETRLKKFGNGLYVVGLDNHTGFLLLSAEGNYFIHSTGLYPYQVVKEKLTEAPLLIRSKYRVAGKISSDKVFLKKWIENRKAN